MSDIVLDLGKPFLSHLLLSGIRSVAKKFDVLAERALVEPLGKYVCDFSARPISDVVRCLRISRDEYYQCFRFRRHSQAKSMTESDSEHKGLLSQSLATPTAEETKHDEVRVTINDAPDEQARPRVGSNRSQPAGPPAETPQPSEESPEIPKSPGGRPKLIPRSFGSDGVEDPRVRDVMDRSGVLSEESREAGNLVPRQQNESQDKDTP